MSERKQYALELAGMSCGSCEILIKRVAEQNGAEITFLDPTNGKVVFWCEEDKFSLLKSKFAEKGFVEKNSPSLMRGNPKRILEYAKLVATGHEKTKVEFRLVTYAVGSAIILPTFSILLSLIFPTILNISIAILPLAPLVILGVLLMLFSYYHINCYNKNLSCTNGMMVGMTIGMMSGFLSGALIGATNGMFVGSIVGMAFGIGQGFLMGKPAGIMGAMEGMMAGIMAGTMGAMTSVMMINDHLLVFLYILFSLCAIMAITLSYMMYREAGPTPIKELRTGFSDFAIKTTLLSALLFFIMLYGPKNGIIFY